MSQCGLVEANQFRKGCHMLLANLMPSPLKAYLDSIDVLTLLLHGMKVNVRHRVRSQRRWTELIPLLKFAHINMHRCMDNNKQKNSNISQTKIAWRQRQRTALRQRKLSHLHQNFAHCWHKSCGRRLVRRRCAPRATCQQQCDSGQTRRTEMWKQLR